MHAPDVGGGVDAEVAQDKTVSILADGLGVYARRQIVLVARAAFEKGHILRVARQRCAHLVRGGVCGLQFGTGIEYALTQPS